MKIIENMVIVFFIGTLSNVIGALIGYLKNKKYESNIMGAFSAGITTSIICFELLNEAFKLGNKIHVIMCIFLGVILCRFFNYLVCTKNANEKSQSKVITSIMSAHNITEGMALGAAFKISFTLGISLMFAIAIHNIPEGMIIGSMLKKENKDKANIFKACNVIGICLVVGSVIGNIAGNFSNTYAMISLALSAGAMLYILSYELIPDINSNTNDGKSEMIYIIGFLFGCLICNI